MSWKNFNSFWWLLNEYLSTVLFKLNKLNWIAQIAWAASSQNFSPYYICWVVYIMILHIQRNENLRIFFFPSLQLIIKTQHRLLPRFTTITRTLNKNYTSMNKITFLLRRWLTFRFRALSTKLSFKHFHKIQAHVIPKIWST